jgi:hypothetical protein
MHRLFREPLLHFLVLGALLFALYGGVNRNGLQAPGEVVVDQARVQALAMQFERVWQRSPTRTELQGLIDQWVREEIIYREGVATGMERDDEVVRRRVVQKMAFVTDGMAADVPSDADLEDWLRRHADDYRIAPGYTLQQVYFDPRRHGEQLDSDIAAATSALQRDPQARVGDPTMLPTTLNQTSADEVTRAFGQRFSDALAPLPDGRWAGPVVSGFGVHLVRIDARTSARVPTLAEVRPAVERDLLNARSSQASEDFYRALRKRYTVKIEADLDSIGGGSSAASRPGSAATAASTQ